MSAAIDFEEHQTKALLRECQIALQMLDNQEGDKFTAYDFLVPIARDKYRLILKAAIDGIRQRLASERQDSP